MSTRPTLSLSMAVLLVAGASTRGTAQTPACTPGDRGCAEVTTFTATVTDFRQSVSGNNRLVSATLRFQNRTARPLVLGYVSGSGLVTDDQGVRYTVGSNAVRGIGEVNNNTFDPKFTLQPGEFSDARFEFVWQPTRGQIYGTTFEIDLAIREIDPAGRDQYRLGRDHALHFEGFPREAVASGAAPAGGTAAPAAAAAVAPVMQKDPCEGQPRCNYAGPFVAELIRLNKSVTGPYNDVTLDFTVRFSNVSTEPLVLGYKSGSSGAVDDAGNRYLWGRPGTHDGSATGIGLVVSGRSADPSFQLAPGKFRDATFKVWFRAGRKVQGTSYAYDVSIIQLEILPSNQLREVREFAVGFQDVAPGRWGGAKSVESVLGDLLKAVTKP